MPAVFTIIQHEPVFFKIWHAHYSRHFDPGEIYVLHHKLPTPKTESQERKLQEWEEFLGAHHGEHRYNLIDVVNEQSFDHEWLRHIVATYQRHFLNLHGTVLFAEVDEIIAPHPESPHADLKGYIAAKMGDRPIAVCDGYEVVQRLDEESAINLAQPLLPQRSWWYQSKLYSKPLLSRVPLSWVCGFHASHEMPIPHLYSDPELLLIHLHKLDWDVCLQRNLSNLDRNLKEDNLGYQNRLAADRLRAWWGINIDEGNVPADLVPIPNAIKQII